MNTSKVTGYLEIENTNRKNSFCKATKQLSEIKGSVNIKEKYIMTISCYIESIEVDCSSNFIDSIIVRPMDLISINRK